MLKNHSCVLLHRKSLRPWLTTRPCTSIRPLALLTPTLISQYDADGDGKLTHEEVAQLVASLPSDPKPAPPKPAPTWDIQVAYALEQAHRKGLPEHVHSVVETKVSRTRAVPASDVVWGMLGMFISVLALGLLNLHIKELPGVGSWHQKGLGLLLGSFGTITVLLFARPDAEAIQAWNLIVGHLASVAVGILVIAIMGPGIMSRAIAMAFALAAMMLTDSVHPPGGALVLLAEDSMAVQSMHGWFLIYPSLVWTCAILLPIGWVINHLKRTHTFGWPWATQSNSADRPTQAGTWSVGSVETGNGPGKGLGAQWKMA